MQVCMYVSMNVCMYVLKYVYMYVWLYVCMYISMRYYNIHVNIPHTRVHTCIHTYKLPYLHKYIYAYLHTYNIHTYIYDPHPTVNTYIGMDKQNLKTKRIRRQVRASYTYIHAYIHTKSSLQPISVSVSVFIFHLFSVRTWPPPKQVGNVLSTAMLLWQMPSGLWGAM